jgi:AraC-like DNA-binding protein
MEHFSRNHYIPKNIKIAGIDRDFIERVNETIRQNLDDSSFGVEDLAKNMNLSTSHFYRKLKLLIGQIPNVYIRNYRLQTAAELISNNPGISIKTVMYEVGFESASHFSHSFKKKYGLTPSEFSQ